MNKVYLIFEAYYFEEDKDVREVWVDREKAEERVRSLSTYGKLFFVEEWEVKN